MSILGLFVVLILIGVLTWAVTTYIPMDEGIRKLIRIAAIVIAVIYLLSAFGVFGGLSGVRVPQIR